ncbi:HDOD domain-containing protein [bacterium]|nr:HDOD domain-containing protein [bacterium]MBU1994181.1 HDOD domain-containing protein [bacterium]
MIDTNDFEYEIYEIFKDQFINNMVHIENGISDLQNPESYESAVNNLFRIFHGIKANSRYFHFEAITTVVDKVEKVLSSLRDVNGPADTNIVEWLLRVQEQCSVWMQEMESTATEFSKVNPLLLRAVDIHTSNEKLSSIMKKISIIYLDDNTKRSNQLVGALKKTFISVQQTDSLADFEKKIINEQANICIINFSKESIKASKLSQIHAPLSAIIVIVDKSDRDTFVKLGAEGIYHIIKNPIMGDVLKRELLSVIDSHFTPRHFLISNKKIKNFIQTLQPLHASILQIQRICNDEEISIKELIKVVKLDPIISGMILKAARNPMYGLEEINTVDHAISIFGKMRVKAIALTKMINAFGKTDLSAYNISESVFSNVAALRLTLMIKWYSKVSISSLSILSTTAILGNIGQLLIAGEIATPDKKDNFLKDLNENGVQHAEEKFTHTTTAYVSSDILSYWQLDNDIIDSIRFSDYPQNAPEEVYHLCLANHIVYRLIELNGNVQPKIPKKIEKLLHDNGLSAEPLQKALDAIVKITAQ